MRRHLLRGFTAIVLLMAMQALCLPARAVCPGDFNGDNVVNVVDMLAVINAWGGCPGTCPPSCAADLNSDCIVNVTDLLAVINAWGACPCTPSGPEPSDSCAFYFTLPSVGSNQTQFYSNANLHNGSDVDYFRILAQETDSSCSCCDGGFCLDEDFRLTIRLTVPAQAPGPYQLCTGLSCDGVTNCTSIPSGQTGELVWTFDGACPGVDNYQVFVRISSQVGGDIGCANYTLSYQFIPGCF